MAGEPGMAGVQWLITVGYRYDMVGILERFFLVGWVSGDT